MLLSIDRVLQLLAEGKSLQKIAELADCGAGDVANVIEEARALLQKHEKPLARKKIIIKKGQTDTEGVNDLNAEEEGSRDIFNGAELSAVPVDSSLVIYTGGASNGNPGPSGIGIVIHDQESRQVGKVSDYIGKKTEDYAEYIAIIRALKIGRYFRTRHIKVRTDSELIVKQMNEDCRLKNDTLKRLHDEAVALTADFKSCRIEHVTRNLNEKADFLAKKGSEQH